MPPAPPPTPPASDLNRRADCLAHPYLTEVYAAADRGDWPRIAAALAATPAPGDRTHLIMQLAAVPGLERWLAPVADTDPIAAVLLARREIILAWQARGTASTSQTRPEQFRQFRRILVLAERRLTRVIAYDPTLGDAWAARITTARGLELDPSEANRRWDAVQRHSPDNLWAALQRLLYLLPKWFGSWEQTYAFAEQTAAAAAPDSPLKVLPAYAHYERWFDLGGGEEGKAYLQQPLVGQALVQAGQTTYRPMLGWPRVENMFAGLFALAGAYPYAQVHFGRIGDLATELPWDAMGEPWAKFVAFRDLTRERVAR